MHEEWPLSRTRACWYWPVSRRLRELFRAEVGDCSCDVGAERGRRIELKLDEDYAATKRVDRLRPTWDEVVRLAESLKRDQEGVLVTPAWATPDRRRVPEALAEVIIVTGKEQALQDWGKSQSIDAPA